jgi:hypothetical protein
MSNNQIPCIDCITLPICKAYLLETQEVETRYHHYQVYINSVQYLAANKCSSLLDYISSKSPAEKLSQIAKVRKFMRGNYYEL